MNQNQRKAVIMGLGGIILILLAAKYMLGSAGLARSPLMASDRPLIVFFNEEDPCECMVELTRRAELQIKSWPEERRGGIEILYVPFRQQRDLELKYQVFRAPSLLLLDGNEQVIWRQDYPLIEGGPFKIDELEVVIATLEED